MSTRKVQLTGIAEWARVFAANRDLTGYKPTPAAEGSYEKYDGACTLDLIMDDANLAALQSAGCPKRPKPDPEGRGQKVKFDRKYNTGHEFSGGAPVVVKEDGSPWDFMADGPIGNGSVVEIVATVYDTKYGTTGTRLDSVRVLDHVSVEGGSVPVYSADNKDTAPKAVQQNEVLF